MFVILINFAAYSSKCGKSPHLLKIMSNKWIQEEERILELSSSFNPKPLNTISVRFVYVDSQNAIQGSKVESWALICPIEWSALTAFAETHSELSSQKYEVREAAIFHLVKDYDHIRRDFSGTVFEPFPRYGNVYVAPTLEIFHDLTEILCIMRPVVALKSILKREGAGNTKTKKVRIREPAPMRLASRTKRIKMKLTI